MLTPEEMIEKAAEMAKVGEKYLTQQGGPDTSRARAAAELARSWAEIARSTMMMGALADGRYDIPAS